VKSEFERASISFESPGFICSQRLCGNLSLASACEALDIPLENHHSALADARACLEIFRKSRVGELPEMTFDKIVNSVGFVPPATLTRTQVGLRLDRKPVNPFSRRVHFPSLDSHYTYLAMLNEFLEDMSLSQSELENLSLLAGELGISADQESKLKLSYLDAIEKACLRDGIISDRESTLLNSFAKLLDIKKVFEAKNQTVDLPVPGSLICVTGTAMIHGINWDKSAWRTKLAELGYLFTDELRKGDDVALLLQESAGSQSSKVRRAMTWGVPRMTFEAFLELLD
jgi:hypothetical protein